MMIRNFVFFNTSVTSYVKFGLVLKSLHSDELYNFGSRHDIGLKYFIILLQIILNDVFIKDRQDKCP